MDRFAEAAVEVLLVLRNTTPPMANDRNAYPQRAIVAARCHEIQASLGRTEVPEFDRLSERGMAVRLANNFL